MSQTPIITISGKKVALGPIHKDLIEINQRWINQIETARFLNIHPVSLESETDWYESVSRGDKLTYFTIYERDTLRPLGGVNLHNIDLAHRRAELGIMIGEPDARGKGYGTEAVQLMCDYGFNAMGLNSIMLLTFEFNIAGQKAYEKAGFKEIGRRREARWFAGRYWDDIYYDILASEFESPVVRDIVLYGIDTGENANKADR